MENNNVTLIGTIKQDFELSHESHGEKFYRMIMEIERTSGTIDEVVLMVSERMIDDEVNIVNECVAVQGTLRTHNNKTDAGAKLQMFVFVENLDVLDTESDFIGENIVELEGFICKKMPLRETPLGRTICDLILAVNTNYNKSYYVPLVTWGRTAKYVDGLDIGTKLKVDGRIQSRTYTKDNIEHTAYEVSVQGLNIIE